MGRRQPTQEIPRAIASCPTLAKRACRWPRRSRGDARRRSPRCCQRVFLDLVRYSNLEHKQALPRYTGHRAVSLRKLRGIQLGSLLRRAFTAGFLVFPSYDGGCNWVMLVWIKEQYYSWLCCVVHRRGDWRLVRTAVNTRLILLYYGFCFFRRLGLQSPT